MQGLPLNVADFILGWVLSILFSDFKAQGLRSIQTSLMVALTEFFYANAKTNAHPLQASWYFSSSSPWFFHAYNIY